MKIDINIERTIERITPPFSEKEDEKKYIKLIQKTAKILRLRSRKQYYEKRLEKIMKDLAILENNIEFL